MVDVLNRKSAPLIEDKQMSRTFRRKVGSNKIIQDRDKQYVASSCRHHGGCDYCKNNRTFEKAISLEDELELLAQDLTEDCSKNADISSEHLKDRLILSKLWNVDVSEIMFFYLAAIDEICIYLNDKWVGYFDDSPLFYDSDRRLFLLLGNGQYKYIEEENLHPAYSPLYGSIKAHHERMKQRDKILLSRACSSEEGYKIKGTTYSEIFEELTDLQRKVRKEQGLDIQEI